MTATLFEKEWHAHIQTWLEVHDVENVVVINKAFRDCTCRLVVVEANKSWKQEVSNRLKNDIQPVPPRTWLFHPTSLTPNTVGLSVLLRLTETASLIQLSNENAAVFRSIIEEALTFLFQNNSSTAAYTEPCSQQWHCVSVEKVRRGWIFLQRSPHPVHVPTVG